MLVAFSMLVSFRRTLLVLALFSLLSYPVALVINPRIGRPLALMSALAGAPVVLTGVSLLRYEVVKLLLFTHDTVFFVTVAAMTLFPFVPMLQDSRVVNVATTFVGMLPNIFVDANLRAVRRLTVITGIQVIAMILTTLTLVLDVVPEANTDLALISYGSHVLPAKMVVTNGMVTLTVLLLRNFFRKRSAVFRRGNPVLQHCVTYRVRLKLVPVRSLVDTSRRAHGRSAGPSAPQQSALPQHLIEGDHYGTRRMSRRRSSALTTIAGENVPEYLQRLRYDRSHQVVDIRNTVVRVAFQVLQCQNGQPRKSLLHRWLPRISQCFLIFAFLLTIAAYPFDMWIIPIAQGRQEVPCTSTAPIAQPVALILVGGYFAAVVSVCERKLLRSLFVSFDFAYLSAHIVIISLCMCDFYRWSQHCVLMLIVCLWMHLGMIIDALTPPVRESIGIHIRMVGFFTAVLSIGSSCLIVYLLIFNQTTSTSVYDRVIWILYPASGSDPVVLSVLPLFYSFFATAIILILRLLFRMLTYSSTDLILIDGPVVFSNCFHRGRVVTPTQLYTRNGTQTSVHKNGRIKHLLSGALKEVYQSAGPSEFHIK